ncbi:MAG: hypothetical protein DHS20C03_08550 [Minwuia thermotolerans]|nr:MAG: hypothetical protein DHS20C03_08550 [Minwuia thermotolerans]
MLPMIDHRTGRGTDRWRWGMRLLLVATIWSGGAAYAQIEAGDARLARLSWSAYICVSFAEQASKYEAGSRLFGLETDASAEQALESDAQSRLFDLGTDAGRLFINGALDGSISKESIERSAPVAFVWRMQGPSPDFMLGRIFEAAMEEASNEIQRACSECPIGSGSYGIAAGKLYNKANCELLGR